MRYKTEAHCMKIHQKQNPFEIDTVRNKRKTRMNKFLFIRNKQIKNKIKLNTIENEQIKEGKKPIRCFCCLESPCINNTPISTKRHRQPLKMRGGNMNFT